MRPARSISVGNVPALSEPPGIPLSEPRRRRPSGLHSVPKRRARLRRRGRCRVARNSGVFQDAVLRLRGIDGQPSLDGERGAASRAAALGPASRAGTKQDALHGARRVRRSPSAAGRGGGGLERAPGHGVPGVADGDAARRRAAPRSRRCEARLGSAPFTLDQLAEWTGEARPEARARLARAVALGPVRLGGPLRSPEEYRRLAETILSSEEWRNARGGPPLARRRTLGRLMNCALGSAAHGKARRARRGWRDVGELEFMERLARPNWNYLNSRASYFSMLADRQLWTSEIHGTGRQRRVENYGTGRRTVSSRSRRRARDPRRAMVDAVPGERRISRRSAPVVGQGDGGVQGSRVSRPAIQGPNPSNRGQTGGKIDAWGAFPAIQRPRHRRFTIKGFDVR